MASRSWPGESNLGICRSLSWSLEEINAIQPISLHGLKESGRFGRKRGSTKTCPDLFVSAWAKDGLVEGDAQQRIQSQINNITAEIRHKTSLKIDM